MIVGESQRAGRPSTRRWFRHASPPHTMQIARSLSTISATAMRSPMAPKGSPRKSVSVPATITRTPRWASSVATATMSRSRNWASSMATSLGGRPHLAQDLVGRIDGRRLDLGAVVAGDVVDAGVAAVEMGLEDLDRAAGNHGAAHAADELLALAAEHDAR